MNKDTICILGGTGFVGLQLTAHLVNQGYKVRVLTRNRQRNRDLLVLPGLQLREVNIYDLAELKSQFNDCYGVVNLTGILNEGKREGHRFRHVHIDLPEKIAQACLDTRVKRLLHMSALNANADKGSSYYLRSKGEGESRILPLAKQGLQVTIFRPSVIFGPEDSFFNRFATLLEIFPFIFPLACPDSRLAPIYVGDVVQAFARILTDDKYHFNQSYELCGPNTYTLKQLVEYTAAVLGLKRRIIGLSDKLSRLQASALEYLPGNLFSKDNYASLQTPSICRQNELDKLDIKPTTIEAVVPEYLGQRNQKARYLELRRYAQRNKLS
ncbi:NAD-dependent epimerase/dehydratase [Candidatus Nitrosoglobus terrae]|uniref:NAD-dependent epimerase/dehydratase n=1 Tax=Candidatus Nitrosoglobus terrae TaxID=1630141 RepID=A0A1Q2SPL9_9GAMM|nr:complex I NDUFA9 subunit family protein [Candidatus Nitrosoglobus terrae]BAW81039.1 NAD-dependent epimerase/dehydratase [Candidatus Nitrosoglobus terrae]